MSFAAEELKWVTSLLHAVGMPQPVTPELYSENLSSIYLTANPALYLRSTHFDLDYHYVWERVTHGALVVKHIHVSLQLADIISKSLAQGPFFDLRFQLGVDLVSTLHLTEVWGGVITQTLCLYQKTWRQIYKCRMGLTHKSNVWRKKKRCHNLSSGPWDQPCHHYR